MLGKLIDYPGPLWMPYSFVMLCMTFLSIFVWGSVLLVRSLFPMSLEVQDWYLRVWMHFVAWIFRIRFEVIGREHHDAARPSLVIANHQSLFDIPLAFIALDGHLRMVAKKELFEFPIFGHCMKLVGCISVDRRSQHSGRSATQQIRERILAGYHIWVAPEGTRAPTDELLAFKKGSFAVAIESGVPVQPLVVEGSFRIFPNRSWLVRSGTKVRIHVLPRIDSREYTMDDRARFSERTRTAMQDAMGHGPGVDLSAAKLSVEGR